MSRKYKFHEKSGACCFSFATVNWIDVFQRYLLFGSNRIVRLLQKKQIHGNIWILHYAQSCTFNISFAALSDPSGLMRDFKGFTSRNVLKLIENNPEESRKEWMLWMFERAGNKNSNVKHRQFWQQNNHPIEIWSLKVFEQKLNYIHNNPVESGFVTNSIDWKYSSARNYGNNDHTILEIDIN